MRLIDGIKCVICNNKLQYGDNIDVKVIMGKYFYAHDRCLIGLIDLMRNIGEISFSPKIYA